MTRTIFNESLDHEFQLSDRPLRIVSLLSSATEAIYRMGMIDRVVGVSAYCDRYVPGLKAPVVGEYLNSDIQAIKALQPDLILITGGIQRSLGLKLAREGLPVYLLPLPRGFHGMLENQLVLGGLMNELAAARELCSTMSARAEALRQNAPAVRPKIYLELWLGRHMRTIGGGSFIHDLLELAGCDPIFGQRNDGYFVPDFAEVAAAMPDVHLFFHEPEFVIDPMELIAQRGWVPARKVVLSTVECGRNVIQEGPSFLDTVDWLKQQLFDESTDR